MDESKLTDIIARMAMAIERAGPDFKGSTESLHDDFIALIVLCRDARIALGEMLDQVDVPNERRAGRISVADVERWKNLSKAKVSQ